MPIDQSENLSFPADILSPAHDKKSPVFFHGLNNRPFSPETDNTYMAIRINNSKRKNPFCTLSISNFQFGIKHISD